jgi:hypothetical protein
MPTSTTGSTNDDPSEAAKLCAHAGEATAGVDRPPDS